MFIAFLVLHWLEKSVMRNSLCSIKRTWVTDIYVCDKLRNVRQDWDIKLTFCWMRIGLMKKYFYLCFWYRPIYLTEFESKPMNETGRSNPQLLAAFQSHGSSTIGGNQAILIKQQSRGMEVPRLVHFVGCNLYLRSVYLARSMDEH